MELHDWRRHNGGSPSYQRLFRFSEQILSISESGMTGIAIGIINGVKIL